MLSNPNINIATFNISTQIGANRFFANIHIIASKTKTAKYVIQSTGMSRNSHMWHFHFSIWLKFSFGEIHFAENPTWIGPVVMSNWRIFRTIENNRNSFLFLAISHNQCCRLPTDPARLHHIYPFLSALILLKQLLRHPVVIDDLQLGVKDRKAFKLLRQDHENISYYREKIR